MPRPPRRCRCRTAACSVACRGDDAGPFGCGDRSRVFRQTDPGTTRSRPSGPGTQGVRPDPLDNASAAALAPSECATIPRAGPCAYTNARTASAHSTIVVRPGASSPGSDSLWLGRSNAMTRCPDSTSGLTKTPRCARQPPQPCTKNTAGPSPHASPAIRCPDQAGLDGLTRRDTRRHAQAHLDRGRGAPELDGPSRPHRGSDRSSSPNALRTLGSTGGSMPEPASSREARNRQPQSSPLLTRQ